MLDKVKESSKMSKVSIIVLGVKRELVSFDQELYFLNRPSDAAQVGICVGLTLKRWGDEQYLNSIRSF